MTVMMVAGPMSHAASCVGGSHDQTVYNNRKRTGRRVSNSVDERKEEKSAATDGRQARTFIFSFQVLNSRIAGRVAREASLNPEFTSHVSLLCHSSGESEKIPRSSVFAGCTNRSCGTRSWVQEQNKTSSLL